MSFLEDIKKTINRGVNQANQNTQRVIESSKLSFKVKGKREELEKIYQQLGKAAYQSWDSNKEWIQTEEITRILQQISQLDTEIISSEQEIAKLKGQLPTIAGPSPVLPPTQVNPNVQIPNHFTPSPIAEPVQPPTYQNQQPVMPTPTTMPPEQITPTVAPVVEKGPVASVVYICPFCAQQVAEQDSTCKHCNQRFY